MMFPFRCPPIAALLLLVATATMAAAEPTAADETRLTWIRNDQVEVGVLLAGGGRIVVLRRRGGTNVLQSDPALWDPAAIPAPAPLAWKSLGGHMIWVAPQAEWWSQQTLTDQHWTMWPPDPWLILAPATVDAHEADTLTVTGTASPVSGLRLTKHYRLDGTTVEVTTTAENIRAEPVRWALWSNLHPQPTADAIVPFPDPKARVELRHTPVHPGRAAPLDIFHHAECLVIPAARAADTRERQGKWFIRHTPPWMAAIADDWCLIVATADVAPQQVAPDHAPIEIYRQHPVDAPHLLELEHHGAYASIAPGDTVTLKERWLLTDYPGGPDFQERARFAATTAAAWRSQIDASPPEPSR